MKKLLIKSMPLVLLLLMSALIMFSCQPKNQENDNSFDDLTQADGEGWVSMYPQGWTCGFPTEYGNNTERWWVETYEELMIAIEKLESNGSTFLESAIIKYEGPLFDVKYCIVIPGDLKGTEHIKFGDDPFDRTAVQVGVVAFCFLDDVSIDEINHGYISDMNCFSLHTYEEFPKFYRYNKNWNLYECVKLCYVDDDILYKYESKEDRELILNLFIQTREPDFTITDELAETAINNIDVLFFAE